MGDLAEWYQEGRAWVRHNLPYLILGLFIGGLILVFFFNRIVILVQPGELGVLWRCLSGTQIDQSYPEGLHVILPFNRMVRYNVRKQLLTDTLDVLTLDGLTITVRYAVRTFLDKDTLPLLHQRVGPDYLEVVVRPEVRAVVRTVLGQYKPEELYTSQKAIQERVNLLCKQKLEARFVSLDSVPIEAITLPARISAAIEAKLSQQQLEQEYEFRLSVASKEAERRKIEAGSIEAYNQTINTSLTPSVLAWQGIQASQELAKSPNAKILLFGSGKNGLPLILNKD